MNPMETLPVNQGVSSRLSRPRPLLSSNIGRALLHVVLSIGAIVMVAPFVWMVLSSLKTPADIFRIPPTLFPTTWQWSNFPEALSELPFGRAYFNSFYISVLVVGGQLLTCSMAAFAFAKIRFRFRNALFLLFLATMMVPAQVTIVPLFLIMKEFGWLNTSLSLIVPGALFNAFGVFLLRQFFMSIPDEIQEAAIMDGANLWHIYVRIMLPLVRPALSALGVVSFMGSWNNFFYPLVFLNSPNQFTVPVLLNLFKGLYSVNWPDMMAASTIAVIPVLIVYIIGQRYIIEGIAMTGIKG
ncbi:carbohydrate ABC transporter permease [Alicyclobacillus herbarius]|uniref:carbohydrate ABC transporter permease n=1 Tax=Alicyclobacillus herbarius TaxID=122960 RepID=UPI0004119CC6